MMVFNLMMAVEILNNEIPLQVGYPHGVPAADLITTSSF